MIMHVLTCYPMARNIIIMLYTVSRLYNRDVSILLFISPIFAWTSGKLEMLATRPDHPEQHYFIASIITCAYC